MRRFRARRIPGTLSLALTNLIGAQVLVYPESMTDTRVHRVALEIAPPWVWGLVFLIAGFGLILAAVTRYTVILHAAGALSLFGWVGITVGGLMSDVTDEAFDLSGLALALFVWMLLGPVSMILVPLIAERYDRKG